MGEPATRLTYEEYLALERDGETKHEYIDGIVIAMAGGTLEHARLCARVSGLLELGLEGKPCRVFNADARVRVTATNRSTYPDVTVVCGELERAEDDQEAIANPVLIVEGLSDSTEATDRGEKFAHLRTVPSLIEYVLISQRRPWVEVFRRSPAGWILSEAGPGETVQLTSVDAPLSIDALYRDALT